MIARFERTVPAPEVSGSYAAFRPYVRADFRQCCAYCCLHEFWTGGMGNFELDHYHPVSLFPHLIRDFYNLRYACHVCNLTKSDYWPSPEMEAESIGFVDLTLDTFADHFRLEENGLLLPLTTSAEFTISILRLNTDHLQQLRAFILRNGWQLDTSPLSPD
jgi:hypothetical protein